MLLLQYSIIFDPDQTLMSKSYTPHFKTTKNAKYCIKNENFAFKNLLYSFENGVSSDHFILDFSKIYD